MAFVFSIVGFFIDLQGVSNKRCLFQFSFGSDFNEIESHDAVKFFY